MKTQRTLAALRAALDAQAKNLTPCNWSFRNP